VSNRPLEIEIIAQHGGLVFVNKPPGLQTEVDAQCEQALVPLVALKLGVPPKRVHALSRLDTGVSGLVTLSLDTASRREVIRWREQGRFRRRYVALAAGERALMQGFWRESIGRAPRGNLRCVAGRNSESAETRFALVARARAPDPRKPGAQSALLALEPTTGRTHQLRVHAAAHGLPFLGDRAYGGPTRIVLPSGAVSAVDRVALHAAWVELPLEPLPLRVSARVPSDFEDAWRALDGNVADIARALEQIFSPAFEASARG
jgi:23S rRNA-/tRNA-specific pseudouridylate synthase